MLTIAKFEDDFFEEYKKEERKIIVYGAGNELSKHYKILPKIDMICDRNASIIQKFDNIPVSLPSEIMKLCEPIYLIISVRDEVICDEIVQSLQNVVADIKIYYLCNNISFTNNYGETSRSYIPRISQNKLKINIVNEDETWIFQKFAIKMKESLEKYNIQVIISKDTRNNVDINHHIECGQYKTYPNDTLMITHIQDRKRLMFLKKQLHVAGMGICMSKSTMCQLITYGIPHNKLCYINPAQDGIINPHKYVIGITNRCYDNSDVRKRSDAILDILEEVDTLYFAFVIMGSGWNEIVEKMRTMGFDVKYYPYFEYDIYIKLMQHIDYYMFMGFDEGAMGYLDAMAAGAGTIVTPQGFHLDTGFPIDYPCNTIQDFKNAFLDLQNKRKRRINAIEKWTWDNYALKHLNIWEYLLKRKSLTELYKEQLNYQDGIFSTLIEDYRI